MGAISIELADNAIVERGTKVLLEELGYAGFVKYLQLLTNGNNDYLDIQEELYRDMTVDEIFDKAKSNWLNTNDL